MKSMPRDARISAIPRDPAKNMTLKASLDGSIEKVLIECQGNTGRAVPDTSVRPRVKQEHQAHQERNMTRTILFLVVAGFAALEAAGETRSTGAAVDDRSELVRINIGAASNLDLDDALALVRENHGAGLVRRLGRIRAMTIEVAPSDVEWLVADAALRSLVDYVELDGVARIPEDEEWMAQFSEGGMARELGESVVPNDEYYHRQWAPACVDLERAWGRFGFEKRSVTIAILDTGVDYNHEDLIGNVDTENGWDFVNDDADPMDDYGHGTACAAVASAVTDNGIGIAGVVNASVLPIKVLDEHGFGSWSDVAAGIDYAVGLGAQVISMSLGGGHDATLERACEDARSAGVSVFAAAGNGRNDRSNYPATFTSVIGVGALDLGCTEIAWYSSRGFGDHEVEGNVEIVAPGEHIYSTNPTFNYNYWSGTSFACPLTAGIGAGYVSLTPWNNGQIRAHLQENADPLGDAYDFGYGRVDAYPFED